MPSNDDEFDYRSLSLDRLEQLALDSNSNFISRGGARAELKRREREYAEQQEQSRRDFETALANSQRAGATGATRAITLGDAFTFRPSYMGIGIDLPKAWNWVRQMLRGRRLR
jgi:hypothetical protein